MKTFQIGGVHPSGNKLSAGSAIVTLNPPKQVVLMLSQHIGAPAVPCVQKGDMVKVGTKVAEAGGFVSAPIFSSVAGKVAKIDTAIDAGGYRKPAIYIDATGDDEWEEAIDRTDTLVRECSLQPKEIIEKIKNAGVVGMGGACFPTHVKLSPPPGCKAECVIINGVECEPYLTADHRLMLEKSEEILVGVSLLMKAACVEKGYIAVESNKPDAIKLLQEKASSYPGIEVIPLKMKYPQGGEKQLIDAVLGRQVPPPPAIPVNVGAIVQNVGTAFAVYEAVQKNKPLMERIVTVTGKSVAHPANLRVRIGTPVSSLIDYVGGMPQDTGKLILGGPMMGKAAATADIPVCKGTSGVLMLPQSEASRGEVEPCIRCAKCVGACPMGLEPYLLAGLSRAAEWDALEKEWITSCIECGCCQFTCPSHRPLLDYVRTGKAAVMKRIQARNKK